MQITGYDIYSKALRLMGDNAEDENLNINNGAMPLALDAVNQICSELFEMPPKSTLLEPIEMPCNAINACVFGVAMLLSLSMGDCEQNKFFTNAYNAGRSAVKSSLQKIGDILPKVWEGY